MNRYVLMMGCVLLVSACGTIRPPSEKIAVMYNPETKDTAQCTIDPHAAWQNQWAEIIGRCVRGYEKAGYIRVDEENPGYTLD